MKLVYQVDDKPKFSALLVFALQQLLAIMTATLVVPIIVGNGMSSAAALFGAGVGTLIYVFFTQKKSPVFLGSSFAFIGPMCSAFAGAVSMEVGYLGIILGAIFAGLVYVVIAIIVKFVGVSWINKLMPAVVIGPTVAIIGLSLAGNATGDIVTGGVKIEQITDGVSTLVPLAHANIALICGLITLFVTILCSVFGKKAGKLIPFIFGILAGYVVSLILTLIGNASNIDVLKIVDFTSFYNLTANGVTLSTFFTIPDFTFLTAVKGFQAIDISYIGTIFVAYVPVAFVVFAEHIADHKNISSIIEKGSS